MSEQPLPADVLIEFHEEVPSWSLFDAIGLVLVGVSDSYEFDAYKGVHLVTKLHFRHVPVEVEA